MADDEGSMQVNNGANGDRVVRVNYPANSNKNKATKASSEKSDDKTVPKKKVERITSGEAVQRKKGLGRKIADTFTGDNLANVSTYVWTDVIVPQIKTLLSDALTEGVQRTFFGDNRRGGSTPRTFGGTRTNYTSYNRYSDRSSSTGRAGEPDGPRAMSSRARSNHDFSEIIIDNRGDAEEVLDMLNNLIKQYEFAAVSDLYDLVGITGTFTDEKWGWTDIRDSGVRRVRDGFLLELPRPQPID